MWESYIPIFLLPRMTEALALAYFIETENEIQQEKLGNM